MLWQLVYSYQNLLSGDQSHRDNDGTRNRNSQQYGSFCQPNKVPNVIQKRSRRKRSEYDYSQLLSTDDDSLKSMVVKQNGTSTNGNNSPLHQQDQCLFLLEPLVDVVKRQSSFVVSQPSSEQRKSGLNVKIRDVTPGDIKTYVLRESDINDKLHCDKWIEKKSNVEHDMSMVVYNSYIIDNFLSINPLFDPYRCIKTYCTRTGEIRYEIQVEGLQEETFERPDNIKFRIYEILYHYYEQQIKLKKEEELSFNLPLKEWLSLESWMIRYIVDGSQLVAWTFNEKIKNYFKTIENMKDPKCIDCKNKYVDKFYSVLQQNGISDIDLNNIPTRYKGNTKLYFDDEILKLKQKISQSIQSKSSTKGSTKRSRENETKYLFKLISIATKRYCFC